MATNQTLQPAAELAALNGAHYPNESTEYRKARNALLAEEIDPDTGEQLGNFPQAFSHMGLINSAIQLQRVEAPQASGSSAF